MFRKKIQKRHDDRRAIIDGIIQGALQKVYEQDDCVIPCKLTITGIKPNEETVIKEVLNVLGFSGTSIEITHNTTAIMVDYTNVSSVNIETHLHQHLNQNIKPVYYPNHHSSQWFNSITS